MSSHTTGNTLFNKLANKLIIIVILFSLGYTNAYAQREINNIYLFDCTGSMKRHGLWVPAQRALDATIETQRTIPGSEFIVIPFGNEPYATFSFDGANYPSTKSDINKSLETNITQAKYTRISNVLNAGFNRTDPNKENKIFLLTDGEPNGGDSANEVANTITKWCSNHKNCRLFYVALINGVINPVIQKAIDNCPDAFIVQCHDKIIPQIADISSDVYTNLQELDKTRDVTFSIPGEYQIDIKSTDQHFNISGNKAKNGKISLSISPKDGQSVSQLHQMMQGNDYVFNISVQCADKNFFIANPNVNIHISDEIPSELTLGNGEDEVKCSGVDWHDSFLWSDASSDQKVSWDLNPIFKNQLPNSALKLRFKSKDYSKSDYQVYFNGKQLGSDSVISITPGHKALIELQFEHNAATGKRYFVLEPVNSTGIDLINGSPIVDYEETTLRTSYSITWNPLKTALLWLIIIILSALIIWFLILKRIFYPTIKISKIEITGPGSYYISRKIRGARRIVLTSKKASQNLVSRIMTGEIRYLRAEHFSPEIYIESAAGKKKVKIRSSRDISSGWEIYPSATFGIYEKGSLKNRLSGESFEIEFS